MSDSIHASEVPADPEKFDLYLLVGQSNMAGRGVVEEADRQPVPGILVLSPQGEWKWQGEPIHSDKPQAGVGLGFAFARLMAEKEPGFTIGLIPCAVGGTFIEEWLPGQVLFENAVKQARLAMKSGRLKGILWHQGESAAGNKEKTAKYLKDLTMVIEGFREKLEAPDVPFVAGQLGGFLTIRYKNGYSREFNEQLLLLPTMVPNTAVVSAKDLEDNGDHLHFNATSLKEFGKRYHEAFAGLVGK